MIRATQILEEYLTLFKKIPIFTNPSRADLREMGDSVRFIADSRKRVVYCWDAHREVHAEVSDFLGLKFSPKVFWGIAEKHGATYQVSASDTATALYTLKLKAPRSAPKVPLDNSFALDFFAQDWTWLDRYFETTPFLMTLISTWGEK